VFECVTVFVTITTNANRDETEDTERLTFSDGKHITRWIEAADVLSVFAKITKK